MASHAAGRVSRRGFLTQVVGTATAMAAGARFVEAAPQGARPHVIDVHQHVRLMPGSLGETLASPEMELRTRLATMDSIGIDQAIIIPGHDYLRPNGLADMRALNNAIAAYRGANPMRFPAAIGVVEPLYGDAGLSELDRIKSELRLGGVSFDARYQGVSTDNALMRRLIARMGKLGLVPYLHAVAEISAEALWRTAALARDFPGMPMLLLDPFSSYEQFQQLFFLADLAPNLLFDTGQTLSFARIRSFVQRFGVNRVVFGSDLYSHPIGIQPHVLQEILQADLGDAERSQILSGNITKLLRIS
jgi:predicted TIM-barrel fold metal-dependent hydrolase